ncbi:hypothetical protein XA68_17943 [Ophiocordyceps unilateralis]|uniref:FAM50A/XAP5 C-terminal domain-containing protein n=1 Tax=Ophiocordyceps unilateralis TaxID=268505 RepID=A0A2A9P2G0_OPHUN|nr:hypothetical protein XA68_17943 [Ophiocordyceps unilateralis]
MDDQVSARFTPSNKTTNERLSTNTVGLVALSDFRKRRAEVLEQQEREAREAALAGASSAAESAAADSSAAENPASSDGGSTPAAAKRKKKTTHRRHHLGKNLLSFDDDDDDDDDDRADSTDDSSATPLASEATTDQVEPAKVRANAAVGVVPRPVTKAALRKEATEREALRREFLALQEAVKATEIAIPFVFYDGAHIPGGTVRLKKGDFVWVFLDRCRKVGVGRKVGEHGHHHHHHRRGWARAGVDDLMLVRDNIIIPHHYDFYYFVMNKIVGPGGRRLFDYSADAPPLPVPSSSEGLAPAPSKATPALPDISTLQGAADDPKMTKVVDRRWYARNKHIYPASTWQEFDAEKDYANEIRKDTGGNTFFFSR